MTTPTPPPDPVRESAEERSLKLEDYGRLLVMNVDGERVMFCELSEPLPQHLQHLALAIHSPNWEAQRERVRRIVRAVNSHDLLVRACRAQRKVYEHRTGCSSCLPGRRCERMLSLDEEAAVALLAALAAAGEEGPG